MERRNIFNVAIFALALVLVFLIGLHYLNSESESLHFSGPNIYRAIYAWEVMDGQGYEVRLEFEGRTTSTGEATAGAGVVIQGKEGAFTIADENNEITIGGPTSGKEDVQAATLILAPAHEGVIKIGLNPMSFESLDALIKQFEKIAEVAGGEVYGIGIEGELLLDSETDLKPTIIQELNNILKGENNIIFYESGLHLTLENADLKDLSEIMNMFMWKNVKITGAATGRTRMLIRTVSKVQESREDISGRIPADVSTYSVQIINKPIQ
ncbi:MAG: TrmB family transcriptional regulator sugar-binding domain-containing protein [archaeon]